MFKIIALLLAGLVSMSCRAEFRDPTQPAYPLPPALGSDGASVDNDLVLSAIWISSQSRRATINGVSGKQGQTIAVGPVSVVNRALPEKDKIATDNKDGLTQTMRSALNLSNGGEDIETERSSQQKPMAPMGNMIAPLLSAAIEGSKLLQRPDQSAADTTDSQPQPANGSRRSASGSQQAPAPMPLSKTSYSSTPSSTIKIISVRPNSVTIEQNGELKTLQLVQRPYKTH